MNELTVSQLRRVWKKVYGSSCPYNTKKNIMMKLTKPLGYKMYWLPAAGQVNKNFNILKANKNFSALGISSDDWMTDPCYVMKNIKKKLKIKKWNNTILKQLSQTVPKIEHFVNMYGRQQMKYGNYVITRGKEIASGSYGVVYRGTMQEKNISPRRKKEIVIKQMKGGSALEFFSECILQMELFCLMRGRFGNGARIPKIEFIALSGRTFIVGMEVLDGDGWGFFRKFPETRNRLTAVKSISILLSKLQRKFKFMHRDLHLGNIMYKQTGSSRYRFYIIDFGMSTANIDGYEINKSMTGNYAMYVTPKETQWNSSQDLRTFILSIITLFQQNVETTTYFKYFVNFCAFSILRYYKYSDRGPSIVFHVSYDEMVPYLDGTFIPHSITKICEYLLKKSDKKLNSDTISQSEIKKLIKVIATHKKQIFLLTPPDKSRSLYRKYQELECDRVENPPCKLKFVIENNIDSQIIWNDLLSGFDCIARQNNPNDDLIRAMSRLLR